MNQWTSKAVSANVHVINFDNIFAGWEQYVMLSSDRHHDNKHCDQRFEKRQLELAKERNAPIIDVGDLFCAMQGVKDRRSDQSQLREEHRGNNYFDLLLDTAEKFYKPYANQFALLAHGNHETSIIKHNQIDLTANLARRLSRHTIRDVHTGAYGGYVVFRFAIQGTKRQRIVLKYFHGSGGGGVVTRGVIQTNRRGVIYPDADIIATGHIHEAWVVTTARERINQYGKLSHHTQWHVSTPTYKDEYGSGGQGWHVETAKPPKALGCAWLRFYYEKQAIKFEVILDLR